MKKYKVYGSVYEGWVETVDAENEEEAERMAVRLALKGYEGMSWEVTCVEEVGP